MKTEILNPNCSEAVFRFYTVEPKEIQQILQAISDEISTTTDFCPHLGQKIPLFETAEEYDTRWNGETLYHGKVATKYEKQETANWKARDDGKIKQDVALEQYAKIREEKSKKIYPKSLLSACAGLGDNEAVVTIERDKEAFRLNIGNNNISPNKTGWTEKIKNMGIVVEEAETTEELRKYARDCTCGIVFFE